MLTEETHAQGVAEKISEHEEAAHEKRNWVRLTFDCNNRCIFCLDSDTHDGEMRDREDVKKQILDGRKKGATRLILSGGEPTIHPNYIDFIKLGRLAGYRKIQTVTNGRLFGYKDFLARCLDAGLSEITFSLHGPNARIHDALVGVKGAFEQEVEGLRRALADGRPIVNIDVVINRGNVKVLPEMLRTFTAMGVREFDLLQVVPFGRAFTEGRDTLFYDLEEMRPYLLEALEHSKLPGIHMWMNRFPPQHLEGYEHLIQDPYKLNDEVRGRKEEFARLLDEGVNLDCRDPARCKYCYLEQLCDKLDVARDAVATRAFERARVDTEWEAQQAPVFGGDPASARRAKAEAASREDGGRVRLNVVAGSSAPVAKNSHASTEELVAQSGAKTLWLVSRDVPSALATLSRFPSVPEIELDLAEYRGLEEALAEGSGSLAGRTLVRAYARTLDQAQRLLAMPGAFEVLVAITRETAPWLLSLEQVPARLALFQPSHERLTEAAQSDVDLADFFARFPHSEVPVEGVPACASGRLPRSAPSTLDTAMLTPEGRLEIFRYARRYVLAGYMTKSLRCKQCVYNDRCEGVHINHVRARGYGLMQPVVAAAE